MQVVCACALLLLLDLANKRHLAGRNCREHATVSLVFVICVSILIVEKNYVHHKESKTKAVARNF